ncbi:MAG: hypothetical protein PUE01_05505 [Clostridiaceae bacterium]|nr:hypothetical protein [Clostridiaceae bacterium]
MSFIQSNRFLGLRSTSLSYKNQISLKRSSKLNNSTTLRNSLVKNPMNNSLDKFMMGISENYKNISYSKLSKYKSNDDNFEYALKRLNSNSNYASKAYKLSAKDSTLDLNSNEYFSIKTNSGKTVTLGCDNGTLYMPGDIDKLSSSDVKEVEELEHLLTYLNHDSSGILASRSFDDESIKRILSKVGIEPGFFDIKTSSGSNKFLMLDNGSIYSEHQVEAERSFYNNTDLIKNSGFTKDSVIIIDGLEYKIGEDGHFNIPRGVRCVAENMIIKK